MQKSISALLLTVCAQCMLLQPTLNSDAVYVKNSKNIRHYPKLLYRVLLQSLTANELLFQTLTYNRQCSVISLHHLRCKLLHHM